MPLVLPGSVDLAGLERTVGAAFYTRGVPYARRGQVLRMVWDDLNDSLDGAVVGKGGLYQTIAYFLRRADGSLRFTQGECTCPVGFNCKHVVALVLAASEGPRGTPKPSPAKTAPRPLTWQESLDSLISAEPAGKRTDTSAAPIAVELTLVEDEGARHQRGSGGAAMRLMARLVTPGRSGWIGGNLRWDKLAAANQLTEYRTQQLRVLRELYAVYQSRDMESAQRSRYYGYYGSYVDEKSIDLTSFESHQLWSILDEAAAAGVEFVHGRKKSGPVEHHGQAEFCLDVTRSESSGELLVSPLIRVAESSIDAAPVAFVGPDGHGVVYVDRAEARELPDHTRWHIHLAKLARPVPGGLRAMALDGRHLVIPAAEHDRFRDEYYPRLRRTATLVSTDESFTPPVISDPTLLLHAHYGDDHELDTAWEWVYQVGSTRRHLPLGSPDTAAADTAADTAAGAGDGYRDPDAERRILADLGMSRPRAEYRGIDTMRFSTETLPRLAQRAGVEIEISGDPADYHEASDTLTIGVSTDEVPDDHDWFDLGVTITVDGHEVPFTDVFVALADGQSHMLLPGGAYFSLEKPELRALRDLIDEARALRDAPAGSLRISRFQAGLWDELTDLGVVNHQAQAWREQVAGLLSLESLPQPPVPDTLDARLRPYQVDGFRWLVFLWRARLGGIIADDMGLGKTLQTLAMICHAKRNDPAVAPFLIVAPTSVVSNWAAEADRFAPGLSVVPLSDTVRRRGQPLSDSVSGADIVVTSYTLFRLDYDAYAELPWSAMILDEAQQVKNHQSKIYQCARRLPAPFKLAITGTPMENNLMELWSLLSITAPGLFPNPTRFREYYAQPIEKQGNTELLGRLRRRMKPLIKRRTKDQVAADLPAKQEQVLEVELHPRHRRLYETHLQRERQKILGLIDDMDKNRFTILRSLTLLRQLSLHAGLVDEAHADLPCGKIDVLAEQLRDVIDGGHRALVFSQFTGFLRLVRERLNADGIEYCYLDGTTRDRPTVLRRFKSGSVPVFLISLKAGGFGLNLTEADYCFLLDPWWNPATEAQAVDRTHRIGQTRNVMVYRLIARDTIEERVMALKKRKAELFANVMDDGNMFGSAMGADDIRELFA